MIKVFNEPAVNEWPILLARPTIDATQLLAQVQAILDEVKINGDKALKRFTLELDKVDIKQLQLNAEQIASAENELTPSLKTAIQLAKVNIEVFHKSQIQQVERIETMPGVWCWRKSVGIEKVGIYIPGGTAPLFSTVLMLGIPAKMAGCKEIILCSPPTPPYEYTPLP